MCIHKSCIKVQLCVPSHHHHVSACYDVNNGMDKWLSKLDSSGWLTHIKDALTCACVAAQCIDKEGQTLFSTAF